MEGPWSRLHLSTSLIGSPVKGARPVLKIVHAWALFTAQTRAVPGDGQVTAATSATSAGWDAHPKAATEWTCQASHHNLTHSRKIKWSQTL